MLIGDQRFVAERSLRALASGIVDERQRDVVLRRALALDVAQRTVEHLLAARDDAHRVTDLLGLLHLVRREQHGAPGLADLVRSTVHRGSPAPARGSVRWRTAPSAACPSTDPGPCSSSTARGRADRA